MNRSAEGVPLVRADLTVDDDCAVRGQLRRNPFQDDALLARWEAVWEAMWQRTAVAFAEPVELLQSLGSVLGWQTGAQVGVDPLVDPVWTEALAALWLHPAWRDVEPCTGQGRGEFAGESAGTGSVRAGFCQHPYGLPTPRPGNAVPFWLEDLSAVIRPLPDCGWGDVQVCFFGGNRLVAAGGSALLLTRDESLGRELCRLRRHPPAALACALGLSQWHSLAGRLARRQELAERYRSLLHGRTAFRLPEGTTAGRVWEMFLLTMASGAAAVDLQHFLHQSRIHAASPLWFQPTVDPAFFSRLPGWQAFRARLLAVPLYAALTDQTHKRIINRINRWVGGQGRRTLSSQAEWGPST
ncbi:MAG: DegT/DnrJ/EryC1/StrS family aminotransferase [Magnetococcus sp. DMHC-8]